MPEKIKGDEPGFPTTPPSQDFDKITPQRKTGYFFGFFFFGFGFGSAGATSSKQPEMLLNRLAVWPQPSSQIS
ncbi:MAG: hypothetical protein K8Q91_03025 [Candidatus Vogelbacteria bacterium]|nr:hypothetical protein [Candidatus Vogelbacteria bacterium]